MPTLMAIAAVVVADDGPPYMTTPNAAAVMATDRISPKM
jgi:hypothetical protein